TKIKFSVPVASKVKLKLYDTTGKEILTLIDEEKQKGVYEYTFNASSLPSGIYFYNISSGTYSVTKKMALLK
ncbi:MAG: T9SS type A sorting domain-containing protein, partial [Clostridiales bacterium]